MTEDDTHDHVVPGSDEAINSADVRGYDFDGPFDFDEFLDAYATTGFQATQLAEAIDIAEEMQEADATVYLTFTSNIVSSGLREAVAYLVREGFVDVLITTSGSLTEDVIKTAKPFKMGSWDADEGALRERGINRLGNIYVPSDRYVWLEEYLYDFFEDFFAEEKVRTPTAFARELGETLDDEHSVLKQAADNDVPVYCPALTDAEVGNFLYYYRQGYDKDVGIEILDDYDSLIQNGLLADETGLIAVGGGVPKHHAIMTNLFRGGADYVVYISTGMEGDGSLSGAPPNEAVSWGKIKDHDTNYTQIEAEATLVFPLLVAGAFKS
ncbi:MULTISPECIES: deoxyhypusine synthase [Haloferax]|uniref:Probable deoxyhypusine synthase n=1 Tax=Haloferax massiliensis TaxID=1476858 RepID=A0A0D6JUA7_9EURY|nr:MULTISPECIES: deoxyhypusine synthase [Haloferax]MDS0241418.1 deoxyhypusine synthase [Haloferax sp. S2CR25]MDS0444539.1 deoxyhypusine synthase [Haloferax sp. S2CR25-2]CQR52139.1 Deoxyhypusine synthase-like protein [Haloferax massiliensis]